MWVLKLEKKVGFKIHGSRWFFLHQKPRGATHHLYTRRSHSTLFYKESFFRAHKYLWVGKTQELSIIRQFLLLDTDIVAQAEPLRPRVFLSGFC
jgi:hypothetical protein